MSRRAESSVPLTLAPMPGADAERVAEAIAGELKALVKNGRAALHDLLPAERELADGLGVSHALLRNALAELVRRGVVYQEAKEGYRVGVADPAKDTGAPVGVIYSGRGWFANRLDPLIITLEQELAALGRAVVVGVAHRSAEEENACIRRFRTAMVGGLVVPPATQGKRSLELEQWIRQGRPVVLRGHPDQWLLPDDLVGRCDRVDLDNRDAVNSALRFLLELGHSHIGLLSPDPLKLSIQVQTFQEYRDRAEINCLPEWFITDLGGPSEDVGRAAWEKMATADKRPTAVYATNSRIAAGFRTAAAEAGISCPRDMSMVTFAHRSHVAADHARGFTVVEHDDVESARLIARLLESQFDPEPNRRPQHRDLSVSLHIRETTAPLRTGP